MILAPFIVLLYLGFLVFWIWVIWMFYGALARIGEELSGIRAILDHRMPHRPPEPATRRPDSM